MYFEEKTGVSLITKKVDYHEFPVVSICFGYNHNVTKNASARNYDTSVDYFSMNSIGKVLTFSFGFVGFVLQAPDS